MNSSSRVRYSSICIGRLSTLVRNYGNVLGERYLASVRYKACFAEVSLARHWQIINDK